MHILNIESNGAALAPSELKTLIEQSLDADKADDIKTIDLGDQTGIADYMVVASGTSSRHVYALAKKIKERLEMRGVKRIKIEGLSQSDWVAIDAGDVIVHLFRSEVREFYGLEKMWCAPHALDIVDNGSSHQISA